MFCWSTRPGTWYTLAYFRLAAAALGLAAQGQFSFPNKFSTMGPSPKSDCALLRRKNLISTTSGFAHVKLVKVENSPRALKDVLSVKKVSIRQMPHMCVVHNKNFAPDILSGCSTGNKIWNIPNDLKQHFWDCFFYLAWVLWERELHQMIPWSVRLPLWVHFARWSCRMIFNVQIKFCVSFQKVQFALLLQWQPVFFRSMRKRWVLLGLQEQQRIRPIGKTRRSRITCRRISCESAASTKTYHSDTNLEWMWASYWQMPITRFFTEKYPSVLPLCGRNWWWFWATDSSRFIWGI